MCWLALAEEKGKDDAVPVEMLKVVDRAFLHGDIVAAAKDALGQVQGTNVSLAAWMTATEVRSVLPVLL